MPTAKVSEMTRTVADVMTRTVVVAGLSTLQAGRPRDEEYRVSALPVTDADGLIVGVVSGSRHDPA